MKIRVLGCGPSSGVPGLGGSWGACDARNKKNRRRRSSISVETRNTRLLVDTPVDMREQCLDAGINTIDAVLYTHSHADHTHGIDDLRGFNFNAEGSLDIYCSPKTLADITQRFGYAFAPVEGKGPWYRPSLTGHAITGPFEVGDIKIVPFKQVHGESMTLGYRFGSMAYSTDVNSLPETSVELLYGLDCWFVDCLGYHPNPSHAHLELTLQWIKRIKPKRTILIHMASELDYETLREELPDGVEPAYDGLEIID